MFSLHPVIKAVQFIAGGGGGNGVIEHGSLDKDEPAVICTPQKEEYDEVVTPFDVVPVKLAKLPSTVKVIYPVSPLSTIPA